MVVVTERNELRQKNLSKEEIERIRKEREEQERKREKEKHGYQDK